MPPPAAATAARIVLSSHTDLAPIHNNANYKDEAQDKVLLDARAMLESWHMWSSPPERAPVDEEPLEEPTMEQMPSPNATSVPAPAPAPTVVAPPLEVPTELPTVAEETKSYDDATPSAPVRYTTGEGGTSEESRGLGRQIGQEHWRRKEVSGG